MICAYMCTRCTMFSLLSSTFEVIFNAAISTSRNTKVDPKGDACARGAAAVDEGGQAKGD